MGQQHRLSRLDTRPVLDKISDIHCVMCIHNESLRLPWVLEYHRKLGVDRFFIIDNASTDGSREYLLDQPDVHCFYTEDSYGESSFGISWINLILDHFCAGHWVVVIDADELLVYPKCESTDLHILCDYLDTTNAHAIYTRMFDMYSSSPISKIAYSQGNDFLGSCPYFDGTGYSLVQTPRLFPPYQIYGGVRKRVFWDKQQEESCPPVLTKLAFVKWTKNQKYLLSTHIMTPTVLSDLTGCLLHFKFLGDFHTRAIEASSNEKQFDRSREYSVYAEKLKQDPNLSFLYEESIKYINSDQLVSLDFINSPESYNNYIATLTQTD